MFNIKEFLGLAYYTSELDQFLADFDKTHPRASASQHMEIEKYRRILNLRDHASKTSSQKTFWDQF